APNPACLRGCPPLNRGDGDRGGVDRHPKTDGRWRRSHGVPTENPPEGAGWSPVRHSGKFWRAGSDLAGWDAWVSRCRLELCREGPDRVMVARSWSTRQRRNPARRRGNAGVPYPERVESRGPLEPMAGVSTGEA